ncbi:MAG: hypothetical protein K2X27_03360 [Candidatus Obscuribacterales bacterium]|nr:hypothetical protein [Candidatus Obscuribacterales bacterium]
MDPNSLIPHYPALPFPAPLWLLQTLLVLGFFLHLIPMNLVLGGGLGASLFLFIGRKNQSSYSFRIGHSLASALPLFISFAITQGIVPLLFLQLLYGPMFYTSSILMAAPWFSIIFFLLIAYYSSYLVIYRYLHRSDSGVKAPLILFCASLIFIGIAYLFASNMTLMLQPEKWLSIYQHNAQGLNLPHDRQILPRLLHSLVGALAVGGLAVGCFGLSNKSDKNYADWLIKKGSLIFLLFSLLQIPVGLQFLSSLPPTLQAKFLGQDQLGSIVFASSMGLALLSILSAAFTLSQASRVAFKATILFATLTIFDMVMTRHLLRTFSLANYISPEKVPVNTQWDLLGIFVLSAVGLIIYLVWLLRLLVSSNAAAARAIIENTETSLESGRA